MRLVGLVVVLAIGLLTAPLAAAESAKVPRIGVLRVGTPPDPAVDGLRQGLAELGYVEGRTILITHKWAGGNPARLSELAAELVGLPVDVIVTGGQQATLATMRATNSLPIVTATGATPATGVVTSLARPGGNVTGLTLINIELSAKKVELLKDTLPQLARLALLGNVLHPSYRLVRQETQRAADVLGLALEVIEVRDSSGLEEAFAAMTRSRVGAFVTAPDEMFFAHRARLLELARRHRLPGVFDTRQFIEEGGFMAYGPSVRDQFRRAASYVDRILKGAKPSDLPIEQPTKFELVINLKTAKALGLTIPQSVLLRADEVIQ